MNIKSLTLAALFFTSISTQTITHAADTSLAIEQMAEIILELKVKPGKDAQMTLEDIAKDSASTDNERLLASSIKNMYKKIRPEDKPSLMKIWLNPSSSESEREMARVLLRFNDMPADNTKKTLSQWVD